MKALVFSMVLALGLYACGRPEPADMGQVEQARQAEKAADQAKPLNDTSLTQIVRAALESESSLDAKRIEVENRDGVVALTGTVGSEEQKDKAGRIVGSVGGVKSVENRLSVDETASAGATTPVPADTPKPSELPK
jgi:hypothetical protein